MKQITLESKINNQEEFTEAEKSGLYELLTGYCRQDTKARFSRKLNVPLSCWANYGIYGRVMFEGDKITYCAGQSYTDEIRTIRKLILN